PHRGRTRHSLQGGAEAPDRQRLRPALLRGTTGLRRTPTRPRLPRREHRPALGLPDPKGGPAMTGRPILARIGQAILVLWATCTLAFILLTALPGDGVATRYADPELGLSPAQIQQMRDVYGADEPILVRYINSLTGALRGDFGNSLMNGESVTSALGAALPNTLALAFVAFVLA